MLNIVYFPEKWKIANVKPLPKIEKDSSRTTSYTPISLLSNFGKLFEIILNNSINSITKLTTDINKAHVKGNVVAACLVDLEKAFDTVWLDDLFFKLIKKGFPHHLLRILRHSLHGRKLKTKNGKTVSNQTFKLKQGLQQGAVM